jgi:hypothetical protein
VKQETNKLLDGAEQLSDPMVVCNSPANLLISVKRQDIVREDRVFISYFLGTSKCGPAVLRAVFHHHTYVRCTYVCMHGIYADTYRYRSTSCLRIWTERAGPIDPA